MTNIGDAQITRELTNTVQAVKVPAPGIRKYHLTLTPEPEQSPFSIFENMVHFLRENNAKVIHQFVFGSRDQFDEGRKVMAQGIGTVDWPLTWIEGDGNNGTILTGTQVFAVSEDAPLERIILDGTVVGSIYEDDDLRYCVMGDLRPSDPTQSRMDQTRDLFNRVQEGLAQAGMDFYNVFRTWYYCDHILDWYDDFNVVRNAFFAELDLYNRLVPASTGIGASNPSGAAMICDILAVQPKHDQVKLFAVPSPLQCPALDYKSAFSRAVELDLPNQRRLYISGTASIEPGGATAHLDDVEKQIDLTMRVVAAILESRDMSWRSTKRSIAYFRDIRNAPLLKKYCLEQGLPDFPIAIAQAHICRDDLLFEIEAGAEELK